MALELEGRVAIVTGGGSGLGRAYARSLAGFGVRVVVNDLGDAAVTVANGIVAAGGAAVPFVADAADWSQARAMVELAVDTFGGLDVLVNNAGISHRAELADMVEHDWDRMIRVHLKGHAAPTCGALAYWKRRGSRTDASVISTTSVAGLTPSVGSGPYSAGKMGAVGLAKAVVGEGAAYGVRSNVVSPSAQTPLTGDRPELGTPDHVAPVVSWLAAAGCPANDQLFHVIRRRVAVLALPAVTAEAVASGDHWTLDDLEAQLPDLLVKQAAREDFLWSP